MTPLSVLYEDNHLLVVDKPVGIATMGSVLGSETMVTRAAEYLKRKYCKPGNAYVGVVSRLDRLVSGVLIFARTSKCASRLSDQIRRRAVAKRYLAIVQGELTAKEWLEVRDTVLKNESLQRMVICPEGSPGGQQAILRLRSLLADKHRSLLEIELITGRKHQIRLQLSNLGHPILGDRKYGAESRFQNRSDAEMGIALHCWNTSFDHPTRQDRMHLSSAPLDHWQHLPRSIRRAIEQIS